MKIVPSFSMFTVFAPVFQARELKFIVHIRKTLFEYSYPFWLPEFFHESRPKYDFQLKMEYLHYELQKKILY